MADYLDGIRGDAAYFEGIHRYVELIIFMLVSY